MDRVKACLPLAHHSSGVTCHEFYHQSPMEYLMNKATAPKNINQNGVKSGSAPGAQVQPAGGGRRTATWHGSGKGVE